LVVFVGTPYSKIRQALSKVDKYLKINKTIRFLSKKYPEKGQKATKSGYLIKNTFYESTKKIRISVSIFI